VKKNPFSWGRKHNMIYIDNPVGAGEKPDTPRPLPPRILIQRQAAGDPAGSDRQPVRVPAAVVHSLPRLPGAEGLAGAMLLYSVQSNPFYPFGESYAGKFVPSLTRWIHERNEQNDDKIT
jgi:hypothetical protein